MKKEILYIGNALSRSGSTVTSIETLGNFLEQEAYKVHKVSSKTNKLLRLLDMLFAVFKYRNKAAFVLIDTYSTTNFWYAILTGKLCRIFGMKYIPILRGGNLPERIKKSAALATPFFKGAYLNVAPSQYLMKAFQEVGYTNLKYIPNTIDLAKYPYKERIQLQAKILWVRSFSEIYNPLMAIKVLQQLLDTYPEAQLCMVGPEKDHSYEKSIAFAKAHKPVSYTHLTLPTILLV